MFLLTISPRQLLDCHYLLMYLWKALPEQNINMQKYFNNALLLLNPKTMKNMHFRFEKYAYDFSLNRSFVLIILILNIVIRKHTKLSHNHLNCFTNDT